MQFLHFNFGKIIFIHLSLKFDYTFGPYHLNYIFNKLFVSITNSIGFISSLWLCEWLNVHDGTKILLHSIFFSNFIFLLVVGDWMLLLHHFSTKLVFFQSLTNITFNIIIFTLYRQINHFWNTFVNIFRHKFIMFIRPLEINQIVKRCRK